jgi:NAD(P)-dependent dehydrogenase (short-subunit alcohol dehydrogenase family)
MASLPSRQDFTGKVAFVAGGASGIGRATAGELSAELRAQSPQRGSASTYTLASDVLASRGAFVSVIDRELSAASVAAEEISRLYGVKAVGLACDVSDYTQVDSAVHETVKLLGRLDCAVNAAAIPGAHRVTGEYPIE